MNSCPGMTDLGVVRPPAEIGGARYRYRLKAPGCLDTDIGFKPARGTRAAAVEQAVSERLAIFGPGLVEEVVQAVLAKAQLGTGRQRLAGRARSLAIGCDDARHSRIS